MGSGTDATYAQGAKGIYKEQGGNRLVVGSTAEIDVTSGGAINIESGGSLTMPVQALGTSEVSTTLLGAGVVTITASTTAPAYTLPAPVAGNAVEVYLTANTSSGTAVVNTDSTGTSLTTSGDNAATFNGINDMLGLRAISASAWRIFANEGSVATGTQST